MLSWISGWVFSLMEKRSSDGNEAAHCAGKVCAIAQYAVKTIARTM